MAEAEFSSPPQAANRGDAAMAVICVNTFRRDGLEGKLLTDVLPRERPGINVVILCRVISISIFLITVI